MMNERSVLTVSQLNTYVKMLLDSDDFLGSLWVRGEISNFKNYYPTGHLYFSVKDEESTVSVVMFRSAAVKLGFRPADGMKVLLHGRVSSYPKSGQYQIYAEEMQPDGVGTLFLAYEQLKRKLEAEGLFDPAKKRAIPKYPERIGVITSPTGAAIHDMITVTGRRFPSAQLFLYPSQVQGAEAPGQLREALRFFNETRCVDVILLGRGGGSMEDLWAFNHEGLVRDVAASKIPVISAVGHESDFTLCDFAADLRAPTPSAAAELAVPDRNTVLTELRTDEGRMTRILEERMRSLRQALRGFSENRSMESPLNLVRDRKMHLAFLGERLENAEAAFLTRARQELLRASATLEGISPLGVLARGYAAVKNGEGKIVSSARETQVGERILVTFRDGEVTAEVTDIGPHCEKKENEQ